MEPSIFELVFPRPDLAATLDAVAAHGIRWLQFDVASAGLGSQYALTDHIPEATAARIRRETAARNIRIAAVSGTYNMIHPDPAVRARGLAGLRAVAGACEAMGTSIITLCTGTRDPDSMWRRHPGNSAPDAWHDLLESLTAAIAIAEEHEVTLAIEPEPANVIANARRAKTLLDDVASPRLTIIMDPANILAGDRSRPPETVLDEAFSLLGAHITVAHAKDITANGEFCATGTGIVPWEFFIARLREIGFVGPLILHGLEEADAARAIGFVRGLLETN